jgi:hypothetical protein
MLEVYRRLQLGQPQMFQVHPLIYKDLFLKNLWIDLKHFFAFFAFLLHFLHIYCIFCIFIAFFVFLSHFFYFYCIFRILSHFLHFIAFFAFAYNITVFDAFLQNFLW